MGRLFHADNVANVRITFKEAIGVAGRAGYFDEYGIIRDIVQNHLMQVYPTPNPTPTPTPRQAKPEDVRDWNIQGLPADAFSTENGVMVTRGS